MRSGYRRRSEYRAHQCKATGEPHSATHPHCLQTHATDSTGPLPSRSYADLQTVEPNASHAHSTFRLRSRFSASQHRAGETPRPHPRPLSTSHRSLLETFSNPTRFFHATTSSRSTQTTARVVTSRPSLLGRGMQRSPVEGTASGRTCRFGLHRSACSSLTSVSPRVR